MFYINNKNFNNLNEKIRVKEVRLVDDNDSRIITTKEALDLAREKGLDLVMVSPAAKPPVCKIMDYKKFLYDKSKKEKEARKKQKTVELKEIRLSATIEDNDITIKANNAKKFIAKENKVKVSIRFRGRQNNYTSAGRKVFDTFLEKMGDTVIIEKRPKLEGNNMIMVLSPKKG
ncbi:translation initiation factor IF-3 [Clostridium tyrobutyricum]|uniref:Translation initiation factor IF-3 n=1 Tax=Clostridium tyrobutyricum DIVETGP TaxID=1408889 RepID=W6N843_CLOTY|nr:translation initiation factor IF-3 [Clostridium tyrobutyricum]AND84879.1 translation initiation factor IF-3 [Clostridium tyrobutyricum]ANP69455.1 translation initiation factor IF-3 [Clostridium tyrobutyricum]MBR9649346.1 translation initiation factor IF-3 [Clostridium tyrobutyricum]MBV4416053.1 translation initiation factor IF-3 [Clostridium tyrobutyricum]MBV4423374.1 translation initiation factor IF-3 [Clostridium tyrobutyricum]